MDRTAEDIAQDRRLAALEQSVKDLTWQVDGLSGALKNVHVRIDRITIPVPAPVKGFWARLFGK